MASLYDYLYHDRVVMLERTNKAGVLEEMHQLLAREHLVSDPDQVFEKILQREEEGSTGLGQSVAIPHVRLPEQKDLHMLIGFSEIGIDYDSVDGQPVHLIFMILVGSKQQEYLKVISKISQLIQNRAWNKKMLEIKSAEELYNLLSES